jgi:hypothetical protein
MTALTASQERRLHELRRNYAARLPVRIQHLMAGVEAALVATRGASSATRVALQLQAHSLCGSAAIFGFAEVSAAARGLEHLLSQADGESAGDDRRRLAIIRQLEVLKSVLPDGAPTDGEAAATAPLRDTGASAERKALGAARRR